MRPAAAAGRNCAHAEPFIGPGATALRWQAGSQDHGNRCQGTQEVETRSEMDFAPDRDQNFGCDHAEDETADVDEERDTAAASGSGMNQ